MEFRDLIFKLIIFIFLATGWSSVIAMETTWQGCTCVPKGECQGGGEEQGGLGACLEVGEVPCCSVKVGFFYYLFDHRNHGNP